MAGSPRALRAEIIPAWRAFLAEAIPFGAASAAAAAAGGVRPSGAWSAYSSNARALRRQVEGGVGQPTAESLWEIAGAARTIDGREWCAGPLFLFAAGRFERFAQTLAGASRNLLTDARLRALLESAESACVPSTTIDEATLTRKLRAEGVADTVIQQQIRRKRARCSIPIRPDRNAWILTDEEEAAVNQSFLLPVAATSLASITARLAELHPEIGIAYQRAIVLSAVRSSRL